MADVEAVVVSTNPSPFALSLSKGRPSLGLQSWIARTSAVLRQAQDERVWGELVHD